MHQEQKSDQELQAMERNRLLAKKNRKHEDIPESMVSDNSMQTAMVFKDGYDIPLYGLDTGMFYYIHILITKAHSRPKELCAFVGFITTEFMVAQILMVNVVAINVFTTMFCNTNISFGKFDCGILLWSFGVPFIGASIAAILEQFGPMGIACLFDAVKGRVAAVLLNTIPVAAIMVFNVLLYILTFIKIRMDEWSMRQRLGNMGSRVDRHIRAARNMSMFVVAIFVQWSSLVLTGVWALFVDNVKDVPAVLNSLVVVFTNLGGVLNLIIYLVVYKKNRIHVQGTAQTTTSQRLQQSTY
ncbi:uncharacterized protein LOC128204471 [Mya arenaria]|uniref:uncharacterized protein LOC128204471 n=1 Tax=Mya arenaria TaxID=6604 RepID=UPI0022E63C8D|nr:uncharacterized protein LOC128204471 [Mya arenaria]